MHGSKHKALAKIWPDLPLLRQLKRIFADSSPPQTDWDATTEPADPGALHDHLCVLVVDDNPVNLQLAYEMLSSWGVKPLQAADGAEAVTLAAQMRLDLILMDIQMPVLDGLAATRRIRQVELELARPRVPVVAYTSSRSIRVALLREFGIDGLLDKPCDAQAMRDCLLRWCPLKSGAWSRSEPAGSARH